MVARSGIFKAFSIHALLAVHSCRMFSVADHRTNCHVCQYPKWLCSPSRRLKSKNSCMALGLWSLEAPEESEVHKMSSSLSLTLLSQEWKQSIMGCLRMIKHTDISRSFIKTPKMFLIFEGCFQSRQLFLCASFPVHICTLVVWSVSKAFQTTHLSRA